MEGECPHHQKHVECTLLLVTQQVSDADDTDTDTRFTIEDMGEFSNTFLTSLRNLASVSDNLFQVEPPNNQTTYCIEVFRKLDQSADAPQHGFLQTYNLPEVNLTSLTAENFADNTGLGFDISNATQLRQFLSEVYLVKAHSRNLLLLSFDNEDTLNCQNWHIDIYFNFNTQTDDDVVVSKDVNFNKVPCRREWKQMIGYDVDDNDNPVRTQETYFMNFVCMAVNLIAYWYVLELGLNISRFDRLETARKAKLRWVEKSQNMRNLMNKGRLSTFSQAELTRHAVEVSAQPLGQRMWSFPNVVLIVSNSFLLLANVFICIGSINLKGVFESETDRYVRTFLGLGCSLSWVNAGTLLVKFGRFRVVLYPRDIGWESH